MSDNIYSFTTPEDYNLRPINRQKFNYRNPAIIFTAGPTGSGKSRLIKYALELLYKTRPDFKTFLIDDYVENSNIYKQEINKIIRDFGCDQTTDLNTMCDLLNPSDELLQAFEVAYFTARKHAPCNNDDPTDMKNCEDIFKIDWQTAVDNNENIAIETTGKKIPLDYLKYQGLRDYNIVFVYSIVSFDELIKRNKTRALTGVNTFLANNTTPAPRLPNITIDNFIENTTNIINTLLKLRNECMRIGRPDPSICGPINSTSAFVLLIFDNDNTRAKLIYDSRTGDNLMTDNQFKHLIFKYHLSKSIGGSKRKKYKKSKYSKNKKSKII